MRLQNIFVSKSNLIIPILFFSHVVVAQQGFKELYRENHDEQKIHFGIHIGAVRSHYNILHSPKFLLFDSINVIESINSTGLNLAGLVNIRLGNHLDFRTYPLNLILTEKILLYQLTKPDFGKKEDSLTSKKVSGVSLALPIEIKFKSDRIDNFRVYMLSGIRLEYDLAANTGKKNNDDLVTLKKFDVALEGAIGFHFYLPFTVLTPEIKFSYGLRNVLTRETNLKYANTIEDLRSSSILFSLTIE